MAEAAAELDPDVAAVVESFEAAAVPPWHTLSVDAARQLEDELFSSGTGPGLATVRDFRIDGPGGELPVRAYRPAGTDLPTLVFYHGGGWVLGTLDSADDICRELADRAGCVVLSADYRLAPDHPFPAAVDDAYAALTWAGEYAIDIGGDPDRLAVAGTSAGANLAGATALRARDDGPDLAGQFLCYPIVDSSLESASYHEHADGPLLTKADMAWFWDLYLRSPVDARHPFANLAAVADPSGLAPATVLTAGYDVLRDEGAAYANRLVTADVPTAHDHYPALPHGFLSLTDDVPGADAAMDHIADRIRSQFG
jgi:acetyl esterase